MGSWVGVPGNLEPYIHYVYTVTNMNQMYISIHF